VLVPDSEQVVPESLTSVRLLSARKRHVKVWRSPAFIGQTFTTQPRRGKDIVHIVLIRVNMKTGSSLHDRKHTSDLILERTIGAPRSVLMSMYLGER
jgi:hypothetical protein